MDKNLRGNVAQTMYHEMYHCFEYSMIKNPKVIEILNNPSKFTKSERDFAKKRVHPITDNEVTTVDGKTWEDACNDDRSYQRTNGFPVEESSFYVKNKHYENLPEAGSMAAFTEIEDKSMAVQQDYSLDLVELDEWIKRNPNKYVFVLKLLSESTGKNLTFKSFIITFK